MGYTPVEGWGTLPQGWSFVEATAVAVDEDDNVWVFNRGAHPVIVFDKNGVFKRSWGEGLIRRAHGITIGPDGTIWLTDDLHHTVRQFTPEGKLLLTLGDPDNPSSAHGGKPFNRPTHVAISPRTGDIYVSDGYGNSRVHKYDPKGRLIKSWGEPGTDPGCFNIPHNIATDAGGRVYVADRENSRVQIFDADGTYLGQFSNLHRPCGLAAAARLGDLFFVGELPTHLAVNKAVPNIGARVSVLTIKGDLVERIGGPFAGEKPGEFVAPHACAVDSRGDLYVAEVSWTAVGSLENPPREIRSLQKFEDMTVDDAALAASLARLSGWGRAGRAIEKTYRFPDFAAALAFVNRVGELAERQRHHPDIAIHYSEVTLRLWSHDAGGVTTRDVTLAEAVDALR